MQLDHVFIAPHDFEAALAFYRDQLGLDILSTWGEAGKRAASLGGVGGRVLVLAEKPDGNSRTAVDGYLGHRPTLHLKTDDIERDYARATDAGAVFVVPLQPTHWKTRWFVLEDPDGNLIAVEQ